MSKEQEAIQRNYKQLADKMDPDHGLLAELFSRKFFDLRQMETIKAGRTFFDRNEALLQHLLRICDDDHNFVTFLSALDKVGQRHIADILSSTVR